MGASKAAKIVFEVGEEVLCYEPDPNKAQVLYDSKILEVVETKEKGKRSYEYRVHFKGWKASWDRFVSEKCILKVDEKNLALQNELAEKANALKAKRKKAQPSLSDLIRASIETGDGSVDINLEDSLSGSSVGELSFDGEGDIGTECVPLVVPEATKLRLEDDFVYINEDNMLVKVPATPTVARILEDCVIHFCLSELAPWIEKMRSLPLPNKPSISGFPKSNNHPSTSKGVSRSTTKSRLEEKADAELAQIIQRTQLIREIAESTRTMFDFMLTHILLYAQEESQYISVKNLKPEETPSQIKLSDYIANIDFMSKKTIHEQNQTDGDTLAAGKDSESGASRVRKRGLTGPSSSRAVTNTSTPRELTDCAFYIYADKVRKFIKKVMNRKLQPDVLDVHGETNPSFLYGSTHLLRLFVKLPEILSKMNMPRKRLAVVVQLLNRFIQYVTVREESIDITTLYFAADNTAMEKEEETSDDEGGSDTTPTTKRKLRNDSI